MVLTHCTDDQTNGHCSMSPVEQFEREGFVAACWKVSKVQTTRLTDFNLTKKINYSQL